MKRLIKVSTDDLRTWQTSFEQQIALEERPKHIDPVVISKKVRSKRKKISNDDTNRILRNLNVRPTEKILSITPLKPWEVTSKVSCSIHCWGVVLKAANKDFGLPSSLFAQYDKNIGYLYGDSTHFAGEYDIWEYKQHSSFRVNSVPILDTDNPRYGWRSNEQLLYVLKFEAPDYRADEIDGRKVTTKIQVFVGAQQVYEEEGIPAGDFEIGIQVERTTLDNFEFIVRPCTWSPLGVKGVDVYLV
jgi:hypothetical protein